MNSGREIFNDFVSLLFALLPAVALAIPLVYVDPPSEMDSKQKSEVASEEKEKGKDADEDEAPVKQRG